MTSTVAPTGLLFGYARCSTDDQNVEDQVRKLLAAGCDPEHVYRDEGVSGKYASRPQWDTCLKQLRRGDTLVIIKLDRAGRSIQHLITLVDELNRRGVGLVVLDQQIDTTNAAGRFFFHVMAALAEFERDLIIDRTNAGLRTAKLNGKVFGRPPKLTAQQKDMVWKMRTVSSVTELATTFGVTRQVIYRAIEQKKAELTRT
jgi:DNA invertase Pin-like site-specific DNA recombinase